MLQLSPALHSAGQSTVFPQPSATAPHQFESQAAGVQPQTLFTPPPPQVSGAEQVPQSSAPPQPSWI
jgi:hypothetical protein